MFYPVDSLKRGGRFYLCWVADSWPLRFAAITHRQLWSQDIRQLCDDLLEVMTNESGRPTNRFSLRLSSQLMRGLVRLYERKATVLLGELCMINANVFKSTNKKLVAVHERPLRRLPQTPAAAAPDEPRVEELLQNSGNVVSNIQDITLKEAVIPDFLLPPNDNFGEENPDQPLQSLLADRTIELMMKDTSHAQISGLDLPIDKSTDRSADKSRHLLDVPQMESLAEFDVTLFRKSAAEDILPTFEKDVPEIPEVLIPEPPAPSEPIPIPEIIVTAPEEIPEPEVAKEPEAPTERQTRDKTQKKNETVDDKLEELEEQPLSRKRRARVSLIVDKRIKLTSDYVRARIGNPRVEMRCEDFTEAIIDIRVPIHILTVRPAHDGYRVYSRMSPLLGRLYQRNLGVAHGVPLAERFLEQVQDSEQPRQRRTRSSTLEKIAEVEEPPQTDAPLLPPTELDITTRVTEDTEQIMNVTAPNITAEVLNVTADVHMPMDVPGDVAYVERPGPDQMQVDISDLPTQKLESLSQVARTRTSEFEPLVKRQRSMGYVSFRESQKEKSMQPPEIIISEPDKENIPPNIQEQIGPVTAEPQGRVIPAPPPAAAAPPLEQSRADAARLLRAAGLADTPQHPPREREKVVQDSRGRRGSESSETPLGSLDRTKVSLGDSANTTDTQRFIRAQWGIEGTMMKIINALKNGGAITVSRLVRAGPLLPGHSGVIAARCFTAILKLKNHGFVRIIKDPETLEINDIILGARFDNL